MTYKQFREMECENSHENLNSEQMEEMFWAELPKRMQSKKTKTIYSIDNEMSRYPSDWSIWNLNRLTTNESIIHVADIPGITKSFTNFGHRFTSFCLHIEDSNMASINVHHEGAPRQWYAVPSSNADKLEIHVQKNVPASIDCDKFIRHKTLLISPNDLAAAGIQYSKVINY